MPDNSPRCAAIEQWIASDSHNSLRPLSVISVTLGMTPKPCAASNRLSVRQVMPIAIRVTAEKRFITLSLPVARAVYDRVGVARGQAGRLVHHRPDALLIVIGC